MSNKKNKKQCGGLVHNFEWWQWLLLGLVCIYIFMVLILGYELNPFEWSSIANSSSPPTNWHYDQVSEEKKLDSNPFNWFSSNKKKLSIGADPYIRNYVPPVNILSVSSSPPPNYYWK